MSATFLNQILEDCFDRAHDPERGTLRLSALTEVLLESLEDAGVISSPQTAYYCFERGNIAAEVHGYAFDAEDDLIQLFYCIDATDGIPLGQPAEVVTTGKELIDRAFRRMDSLVRRIQSDRIEEIEESQPVWELVQLIREAGRHGMTIELHVITTGKVSERTVTAAAQDDVPKEIWDILRLERVCGNRGDGSITIDFGEEFGGPLPCLVTPSSPDGLRVLLMCIPGKTLAEIYNRFRASLLERNVRSFLQFTGKVNKGIRSTLLDEPHRFLPYNNGLSATAGDVEFDILEGGLGRIRKVRDFQIVNGGQTTATLASCLRRDRADLQAVSVPMKLTVVPRQMLDGLVPKISRFANTQNRVQDSDFSANDPWHIAIERLSRNTWTRGTADAPRGTRWFYERSRGQYADALAACQTPAGKKQFRAENPPSQKFTKTDLAKFMLSWDQHPAIVSRGAQKCFMYFMSQLAQSQRKTPDESDFKRIVALAILFRKIEKLYGEMNYQGFRANVVAYSIARLSHDCKRYLDIDAIWKHQEVPDTLVDALKIIVPGVYDVIANPPPNQRNVTEWCKKDDCWAAVLDRPIDTRLKVAKETCSVQEVIATSESGLPLRQEQQDLINAIYEIAYDVWFSVSNWAKTTGTLQSWQRGLAYSLGRSRAIGRGPSIKQAIQGRNLLLEAIRLGYQHDHLRSEQVEILQGLERVTSE